MMTILQNTQAFWTVLLGWMINNEKFLRVEAIGIAVCFIGVMMMAVSEDPAADVALNHEGWYIGVGRSVGVLVMVYVAFNDGLTFVMARTMKSIHFSVMMFWFSTIGMIVLLLVIAHKAFYL